MKRSDSRENHARANHSPQVRHLQVATTLMASWMTRREFVYRSAVLAAGAVTAPSLRRHSRARPSLTLRIGIVAGARSAPAGAALGIQLGVEEAQHAAQLFGGAIETIALSSVKAGNGQLSALIGSGDARECTSWADQARRDNIVFINIGCTSDALRGEGCNRAAFHVVPSDAMYRDASAMIARGDSPRAKEVVAWDPSLSRYGADTLNQRFHARFGQPMTSDAWTGWFAVKVLWESMLRAKAADGRAIGVYLDRETTQFDGHKGQPLSFRAWDHQLRQPVYARVADPSTAKHLQEIPEPSSSESARDALDNLGPSVASTSCRFNR